MRNGSNNNVLKRGAKLKKNSKAEKKKNDFFFIKWKIKKFQK